MRGEEHPHATRDLAIAVAVGDGAPFKRGNANGDASFDVSDGVFILNFLFLDGERPECLDAADTNNDGRLVITDGIAVFGFLFFGFAPPAMPGPFACGPDSVPDELPCGAFTGCTQ